MDKKQCTHHWSIDSQGVGYCKICGARNEFANYWNVNEHIDKRKLADRMREVNKYRYLNRLVPLV